VVPRWTRIAYVVFGLIWIVIGTLTLTKGDDTGLGVVQLMIAVGWLMIAAFKGRRPTSHSQSERDTARR
jgi:hypothetical protein